MKHTVSNELIETINAMQRQEKSGYRTERGPYNRSTGRREATTTIIDAECRKLMVLWCKQLADYCNFNHHTVAIAINILDRFVAKDPQIIISNPSADHDFQLVAIASLYTSIKVHEVVAIDPMTMSKLCKGAISPQEIEVMEARILTKLGWRVNAPTAMAFAEMYLKILLPNKQANTTSIKRLIQCQIEHALEDYRFLGIDASEIAFTATNNALTATFGHASYMEKLQRHINVNFLTFRSENMLMDHMKRSESATIFSLRISTTRPTKKKQRSEQKLMRASTRHHLSPRSSITMPR